MDDFPGRSMLFKDQGHTVFERAEKLVGLSQLPENVVETSVKY